MLRRFHTCVVVYYAITRHIDAHIRRRFIKRLAVYPHKHTIKHGKNFDVTIVINCTYSVSLEVIRIYHVYVVKIGSCRLIRHVYHMLERKIPYRECLELGISGLYSSFVIMIKLGYTCCHLATSRPRRSNHYKFSIRFDIIVFTQTFVADYPVHVIRVIGNIIMTIGLYSQFLERALKSLCQFLIVELSKTNAAYVKSGFSECVYKS